MNWKIPSKCFLSGEYSALNSGPAIILTHPPYFSFDIDPAAPSDPFPKGSPAEKIWTDAKASGVLLDTYRFTDAHAGLGGFGGSTAEFASAALAIDQKLGRTTHAWTWRDRYRKIYKEDEVLPSGVDLIAQLKTAGQSDTQLVWIDSERQYVRSQALKQPSFFILRTGHKVKTHQHLSTLAKMGPLPELARLTEETWSALCRQDWPAVGKLFASYQNELKSRGWLAPESQAMLEDFSLWEGFLGAKACGAMGADALVLCFTPNALPGALASCREKGLTLVWSP